MKVVRRLLRMLRLGVHLLSGLLRLVWHIGIRRRGAHDPVFRRVVRGWQQRVLGILGLRVELLGKLPRDTVLVVSNHVSWLDIPVLAALLDPVFLSKAEIRRWPLLGWLASGSGTLFIERGRPGQADLALTALAHCLEAGHDVLFFPEGTTTDGSRVRRFHARLFQSAIQAGVAVQPVALCYRNAGGIDRALAFTDDNGALRVLWEVLGRPVSRVEVHLLPPLMARDNKRDVLARGAQKAIERVIVQCAAKR